MSVDLARQQWSDGARRLNEASRDPLEHDRLIAVVGAIVDELRRRVGSTYTLAELVDEYGRADRWARDIVADAAPAPGWPRQLATAGDAAFHVYARGAVDYTP